MSFRLREKSCAGPYHPGWILRCTELFARPGAGLRPLMRLPSPERLSTIALILAAVAAVVTMIAAIIG